MNQAKKMKRAQEKRDLVFAVLGQGKTKADAFRAVKAKFGSGIATRDVMVIAENVKQMTSGSRRVKPQSSSPRTAKLPPGYKPLTEQQMVDLMAQPSVSAQLVAAMKPVEDGGPAAPPRRIALLQSGKVVAYGVWFNNGSVLLDQNFSLEWLDP